MNMKTSFFLLLAFMLSCNCEGKVPVIKPINYPDKNLKEIIIRGSYTPKNPKEVEELKKDLLSKPTCTGYDRRKRHCGLLEGETLEKALRNRFPGTGEEAFGHSSYREYCYNKTDGIKKKSIFKENLRARLYDKNGKLLTEDFFRWNGHPTSKFQSVISYLPYDDKGHRIYIVSLNGKKEVILYDMGMLSQSKLREISLPDHDMYRNESWVFNEKSECHIDTFD